MSLLIPTLQFSGALFLGYIFFIAGYHKLKDSDRFLQVVREYDVLPVWAERPALSILALLEITTFVALLSPYIHYAVVLSVVLLGLYILVMSRVLILGRRLEDCGCGLPNQKSELSWWLIVRNLTLMILAISILDLNILVSVTWLLSVPVALFMIGLYTVVAQIHQNQIKLNYLKSYSGVHRG